MAFLDLFKKKKSTLKQQSLEEQPDFAQMSPEDKEKYVESLYETIRECNQFIREAKKEYKIVGAYFSDIQIIETQPEEKREQIRDVAKRIMDVSVDRRIYKNEEGRVSAARYRQMTRDEETIVAGMKKLQNDEAYQQLVKRDMNLLEGEKESLRITAQELEDRQETLRKVSVSSVVAFGILFLVMIIHGFSAEGEIGFGFLVILLIAAAFLALEVAIYSRTIYEVHLTQKRLNKAIFLSNRVKIKYLNATNLVDYQYEKYDVKNSYELAEQYQLFLEAKKQKENYRRATMELSDLEEQLLELLASPPLFDSNIWLEQVRALCDTKEMVEIRHNYSTRRQKLRKQIEESQKKAEEAADLINLFAIKFPSSRGMILAVKDRYVEK